MLSWFSLSVSRGGAKKKLAAAKDLIMSPNHNICHGFILFFDLGQMKICMQLVKKLFFEACPIFHKKHKLKSIKVSLETINKNK